MAKTNKTVYINKTATTAHISRMLPNGKIQSKSHDLTNSSATRLFEAITGLTVHSYGIDWTMYNTNDLRVK